MNKKNPKQCCSMPMDLHAGDCPEREKILENMKYDKLIEKLADKNELWRHCEFCGERAVRIPILIGDVIFKLLDNESWATIEKLINLWSKCGNRSLQQISEDVEERKLKDVYYKDFGVKEDGKLKPSSEALLSFIEKLV